MRSFGDFAGFFTSPFASASSASWTMTGQPRSRRPRSA